MSGPVDRHTVDQLVVEHLPASLGLALKLTNNRDTAEEIVQEALCRVLAGWKSFRGEASFRTWMMQIVVNVDRDRRRRRRDVLPNYDDLPTKLATAGELAEAAELNESIREIIQALPDRQREVAVLSFGDGMDASTVAHVLGISEANVHTCLHLARKCIARAIGYDLVREK